MRDLGNFWDTDITSLMPNTKPTTFQIFQIQLLVLRCPNRKIVIAAIEISVESPDLK